MPTVLTLLWVLGAFTLICLENSAQDFVTLSLGNEFNFKKNMFIIIGNLKKTHNISDDFYQTLPCNSFKQQQKSTSELVITIVAER